MILSIHGRAIYCAFRSYPPPSPPPPFEIFFPSVLRCNGQWGLGGGGTTRYSYTLNTDTDHERIQDLNKKPTKNPCLAFSMDPDGQVRHNIY